MSPAPSRIPETDTRNVTTIGKAVKVVGQIITKEDLDIDGDVEGTIESKANRITIGLSGRVQANISACNVVILGQVQGNVAARLVGDITTSRISIEDGAVFKGSIDINKTEPVSSPAPGLKFALAEPHE